MRVSSISEYQIPVRNIDRAVRFYREVFDFPVTFTAHEQSHLKLNDQSITFEPMSADNFKPISLNIVVQNTTTDIQNHFINYEVPLADSSDTNGQQTIFHITDFEGNQINVITNK